MGGLCNTLWGSQVTSCGCRRIRIISDRLVQPPMSRQCIVYGRHQSVQLLIEKLHTASIPVWIIHLAVPPMEHVEKGVSLSDLRVAICQKLSDHYYTGCVSGLVYIQIRCVTLLVLGFYAASLLSRSCITLPVEA